MRFVLLVCAGCGAVMDAVWSPYTLGEMRSFVTLLLRLNPDVLVVGDSLLGSFFVLGLATQRQSHALFALRRDRKERLLRILSNGDELHLWQRPPLSRSLYPHLLAQLPMQMRVRIITAKVARKGYRTWTLRLCTTLLDPQTYPADELVALYLKRWNVETDLRSLKLTHGVERLSGKDPKAVCREFFSALLAYNCVRALMTQAGNVRQLSYEAARTLICDQSEQMSKAPTVQLPRMYQTMLEIMRRSTLDGATRPAEPRALVENIRRFPLLREPREEWKIRNAC
jgi:hypothetical protein